MGDLVGRPSSSGQINGGRCYEGQARGALGDMVGFTKTMMIQDRASCLAQEEPSKWKGIPSVREHGRNRGGNEERQRDVRVKKTL